MITPPNPADSHPTDSRRAWLLLNPVTAAVLGVVVLDESLSLPQVAGAVVVLTGLGLGSGLSPALTGRRRPDQG